MTTAGLPYANATAFRTALKDRLAAIATTQSNYTTDELHRQFAYDRALARIFSSQDADRWVLKGAGALLARLVHARHSKDIDVYFTEQWAEATAAVASLRNLLARDLGDFFGFEITRVTPLQEEAKGSRVHVQARLGPKPFATFHIDVVVRTTMTGQPDLVNPLTPLVMDGLIRPQYRTFPVTDHLADKLCAIVAAYQASGRARVSTRIKDLVDIALIATTQRIDGSALRTAIVQNIADRGLEPPDSFVVPDPPVWKTGYPKVASDAPVAIPAYDEAVRVATELFTPILAGVSLGFWDPASTSWLSARSH
ncbi:nucleotidyltransferase AbiEii toxin of type IV toxin-antitoxin system [Haloactinopolyspora alba]|uniref:Nucleotidyltransferase AbiEii toxin of type IV toxin-antitoxin system n=1 Tax=Haloactinopolyspora alba TaxID=648780 RepID=A0A2P8E8X9_9ACTN|nr:nucleotidyl transferase AbiEii/AbiGii toxin family protein [Haloactinopolyspora alba]PSL05932.1 nucleotidyltransferase AbiEii toxin of type IV toxin-antitoxin system [Haloactinopolyspora alba]